MTDGGRGGVGAYVWWPSRLRVLKDRAHDLFCWPVPEACAYSRHRGTEPLDTRHTEDTMKTDIKDTAVETKKGPGRVKKVYGTRALVRFITGEEEWHDASYWYLCDTPVYVDGPLLFDAVQTFKDYVFETFGETVALFRVDSAYRDEKGCAVLEDLQ